ncbi:MAG: hypothetical protein ABSH51_30015 [Solirubrobacteraceae bacterium]|jgi:hypothetical protein
MATARGPIPNRPDRRIALSVGGRRAGAIVMALIAALIGWIAHTPGTKTVTHTIKQAPATIHQDTPAGAVAAVQAFFARTAEQQAPPPAPRNGPGKVTESWQLGWRMTSYTPLKATVETWGVVLEGGFGTSGQSWLFNDVPLTWQGGRWVAGGPPTSWSKGRRLVTVSSAGATPPADSSRGGEDVAFGRLLSSLRRFPGAP